MTNKRSHFENEALKAEAAAWFAQLDSDAMSPQDLGEFNEWMNRSPQHQQEMKALARTWGALNDLTELSGPIEALHRAERKLTLKSRRGNTIKKCAFAAIICFAFVGVFLGQGLLKPSVPQDQTRLIVTQIGEQRTTILPDGSSIIINTNSRVEIDYDEDTRKIRLLSGEAIFDVVPDKTRPLIVYAGDGFVRAVGTIFAVRLENDIVNVSVSEGAVEIGALTELISLGDVNVIDPKTTINAGYVKSGHVAILENNRTQIEPNSFAEIESNLSWQNGVLTFSGEPLERVVREVSRYTALDIKIDDPAIRDIRIGGIYPTGDMDLLFEALELGFNIDVDRSVLNEVSLRRASKL